MLPASWWKAQQSYSKLYHAQQVFSLFLRPNIYNIINILPVQVSKAEEIWAPMKKKKSSFYLACH